METQFSKSVHTLAPDNQESIGRLMAFAGRLLAAGTGGPKEMEERTNPSGKVSRVVSYKV
jgi:hypothetical protein